MRKENLTNQIYDRIHGDILSGKYADQPQLPSITQLCELYHVGRNTIRGALKKLETKGLIMQEKGKQAVVVFNLENQEDHLLFYQQIYGKAPYVGEVFETLYLLMPDITVYALQKAKKEDIAHLKQLITELKYKKLDSDRLLLDALMNIYASALILSGNTYIKDIAMALMEFVYIGIPDSEQNYKKLEKVERYTQRMIGKIFEFILMRNPVMVRKALQLLISTFSKITQNFTQRYQNPMMEVQPIPFTWKKKRSRDYLYISIVSDIVSKIMKGVYQDSFMSIEELAQLYQVSTRTSRKVIQVLNEYQMITTVNGIGSFVQYSPSTNAHSMKNNKELYQHVLEYKQALEFLKLCVHCIGKEYMKQLSEEAIQVMIMDLELEANSEITSIIEAMFTFKAPLRVIYQELQRDMQWAFCVVILNPLQPYEASLHQLKQKVIHALKTRQLTLCAVYVDDMLAVYEEHVLACCKRMDELQKKRKLV